MSLLEKASLIVTPNAYKESVLYSVVPNTTLGDMDVVRATTATRVNSAGLIEVVPRNLLQYSNDFSNAAWTKNNATVTSNNIISPDGTLNASLITSTDTSATGIYSLPNLNGTNTWSFYGKKGTARYIFLNTNVPLVAAKFDLQDGVVIGTTGVEAIASIQSVGNDWYRCIITSSISIDRFTIFITNNTTVTDISSSIGLNFYLYGAQLEQGSTATTYFPTTTRLNIPRIDYTNGSCPSLLVEPQRTNLLTYSSDFSNSTWDKQEMNITINSAIAPDGTMTANFVIPTAVTSTHQISKNVSASGVNTMTVFAKANGYNTIHILDFANGFHGASFNLSTGVVTNSGSGIGSIQNMGNGWYRCIATATTTGIRFYIPSPAGDFTGNGTSGIYIWGAQLEQGSYASSYIPTVASSVTRNADIISKTGISSLIGQTEGTVLWDIYIETPTATDNENILNIDNGSFGNTIYLIKSSSASITAEMYLGGSVQASFTKSSIIKGRYKCAFAYANNNTSFFINGVQIGSTDTSCSVPATSRFQMGLGALGASTGFINSSQLYKTRLTNTELQSLTTI